MLCMSVACSFLLLNSKATFGYINMVYISRYSEMSFNWFLFNYLFLVRQKSHNIKSYVKAHSSLVFILSQVCAITTSIISQIIFITPKQIPACTHYAFTSHPHLPPAPGNCQSTFCLYAFICSRYSIQIESYTMWLLVSGFFHLA